MRLRLTSVNYARPSLPWTMLRSRYPRSKASSPRAAPQLAPSQRYQMTIDADNTNVNEQRLIFFSGCSKRRR